MNVRRLQERLLILQRRGMGDNAVSVEVGAEGTIKDIVVLDGHVWVTTTEPEEQA